MDKDTVLRMCNISKTFPGVVALDNVMFELKKGEVHALLGENGAGKSTLIKILAGIYQKDHGDIEISGERKDICNVQDAKALGISVIHQEISLVPKLSVANNILLGTEGIEIFLNRKKRKEMAVQAMKKLDFYIDPDTKVDRLSIAQQQMLEIIRALSVDNAKIIVMDEPTASISEKDTEKLFATIRKLKADGIAVIYISHRMEEVMQIADRITVFRDGKYVNTKNVGETNLKQIVAMMVGRQFNEIYHYNITNVGETVLEAKCISNDTLKNVSFDLKKGEVHGLYGLIGAGRTEFARAIFGIDKFSGEIEIKGKKATIRNSKDSIRYGLALVPENRKLDGLVMVNTVRFNSLITLLDKFIRFVFINRKQASGIMGEYKDKLRIKYSSPEQKVETLSGGNQQKIVLSKWLGNNPEILILDEPTRGIDIGAKFEIYDLIFKLTDQGKSILLISSELPEIINLCTRVSIMNQGNLVATIERNEFDQERIFEFALS